MILIDKQLPLQRIVFSSNSFNDEGSFLLKINADSGKQAIQFPLVNNSSIDVDRCFIYQLDTDLFNDLQSGFYSYDVIFNDVAVTSGKLLIKDIEVEGIVVLPEAVEDREFIIYDGQ